MYGSVKLRARRWLLPGAVTFGTSLFIAALAGCGDDDEVGPGDTDSGTGTDGPITTDTGGGGGDTGSDGSTPGDNGNVSTVTAATPATNTDFVSPFDSTPDPAGTNVYFTAIATSDGAGAVFKVAAAGGAVTKLFSGTPLVTPLGIAITTDGTQLFIADPAASTANDKGQIYVLPASGGTPTPFGGTEGYRPKSVVISGANLFFTGVDKADGKAGIFKVPVTGGSITVVASGGVVTDPSGVAANLAGDVFFVETTNASGYATIYKVPNAGQPVPVHPDYKPGYPSGIALSGDGTALLASAISRTTFKDEVHRIDLASGQSASNSAGPIGQNIEAAGLHRAHSANVYSWVDSLAGGTGTIYVLK